MFRELRGPEPGRGGERDSIAKFGPAKASSGQPGLRHAAWPETANLDKTGARTLPRPTKVRTISA